MTLAIKYHDYRLIRDIHKKQVETLEKKFEHLLNLEKTIGYGGAIHNFKNYVLRRQKHKLAQAKGQFQSALLILEKLDKLEGHEYASKIALIEIRAMVNSYLRSIEIAEEKHLESLSSSALDKLVKVDDTAAILNLNFLIEKTNVQKDHYGEVLLRKGQESSYLLFFVELLSLVALYTLISFIKKRTRNHQRELESTYFIIDEAFSDVLLFDLNTLKFVYANKGARVNLGYEFEELKQHSIISIAVEFNHDDFMMEIQPLLNGEMDKLLLETVFRRSNGTHFDVQFELQVSSFKGARVFAAMVMDVSEQVQQRNKFNETLAEMLTEERTFKSMLEISTNLNVSLDEKLQIALRHIMAIPYASRMGKGGILLTTGESFHLVAGEGLKEDEAIRVFTENSEKHYHVPIINNEKILGGIIVCLEEGHDSLEKEIQILEACAEILEKIILVHRYEEQTVDVRRQEAVSMLIATYNHEINNPLAIVKAAVAIELKKNPQYKKLETIDEALDRIEQIVREISSLSYKKKLYVEDGSGSVKLYDIKKKVGNQ